MAFYPEEVVHKALREAKEAKAEFQRITEQNEYYGLEVLKMVQMVTQLREELDEARKATQAARQETQEVKHTDDTHAKEAFCLLEAMYEAFKLEAYKREEFSLIQEVKFAIAAYKMSRTT